jgi:hypothetical protein
MNDFINPYYQNTANQSDLMKQLTSSGNSLAQQAMTIGQKGSLDGMKMANALRQGNQTQLTPQQHLEVLRLGSNPWSSTSDYSTGANGWGNYGE